MQQRARIELESKTGSEIADWMYERWENRAAQIAGQAEFLRRQTEAQQEAARAAVQTAEFTRANARYMLWSVLAVGACGVLSTVTAVFALHR